MRCDVAWIALHRQKVHTTCNHLRYSLSPPPTVSFPESVVAPSNTCIFSVCLPCPFPYRSTRARLLHIQSRHHGIRSLACCGYSSSLFLSFFSFSLLFSLLHITYLMCLLLPQPKSLFPIFLRMLYSRSSYTKPLHVVDRPGCHWLDR